jgi:hypothetical protein
LAASLLFVLRRPTASRQTKANTNMDRQYDYYSDLKFCAKCDKYVSYLMSMDHSYCTACGERVRLFSEGDWAAFNETLSRQKPKGGRPRGQRGKESA